MLSCHIRDYAWKYKAWLYIKPKHNIVHAHYSILRREELVQVGSCVRQKQRPVRYAKGKKNDLLVWDPRHWGCQAERHGGLLVDHAIIIVVSEVAWWFIDDRSFIFSFSVIYLSIFCDVLICLYFLSWDGHWRSWTSEKVVEECLDTMRRHIGDPIELLSESFV